MNRFENHSKVLTTTGRGVESQRKSLALAHRLLETGWGLFLGEPEEQQAELAGTLVFEAVKVRFYPPVLQFILEGDRRHPKQQLRKGAKDPQTGQYQYVDYLVSLQPRSLKEFSFWVYRHMGGAQVLAPPQLVEQHRKVARDLVNRYL